MFVVLLLTLVGLPMQVVAQTAKPPEPCGTMHVLEAAKSVDPFLEHRMVRGERAIQKFITDNHGRMDGDVITIPTVVHILYNNDVQNIPEEAVYSQIEVINEDFRRMNADTVNTPDYFKPIAADMQIELCLATRDPEGNPTNGITRTFTEVEEFPYDSGNYEVVTRMHFSEKGGTEIWDRDQYLNVWVLNLDSLSFVLGFAYLPGADPNVDGIVCNYKYFGRPNLAPEEYQLGRVMTHELGHWLNLWHPFNDSQPGAGFCSDDFVDDTPSQREANFGCPSFPYSTCDNYSDMYMNYMDYTDDDCANMFSLGQKERSYAALHVMRPSILESLGCAPLVANDINLTAITGTENNYCLTNFVPLLVNFKNTGNNDINSLQIRYTIDGGDLSAPYEWTGTLAPGETISDFFVDVAEMSIGSHELNIFTELPNGETDPYPKNNSISKIITVGSGIDAPYFEDFSTSFTQSGWLQKDEASAVPWQQIGEAVGSDGAINSVMAVKHDFHDYFEVIGSTDQLISPNINLANIMGATLSFDVSYRYANDIADGLEVQVSTSCGFPYEQVYFKEGAALETRQSPTPQTADDWRTENIDLSSFDGESVVITFNTIAGGGSWLFIDNVRITGEVVGINENNNTSNLALSAIPNPFKEILQLNINSSQAAARTLVSLYNTSGHLVHQQRLSIIQGNNELQLDTSRLKAGIYYAQVVNGTVSYTIKVVKGE